MAATTRSTWLDGARAPVSLRGTPGPGAAHSSHTLHHRDLKGSAVTFLARSSIMARGDDRRPAARECLHALRVWPPRSFRRACSHRANRSLAASRDPRPVAYARGYESHARKSVRATNKLAGHIAAVRCL